MKVDNVSDLIAVLESFEELQLLSIGFRKGHPCLFVHSQNDYSNISGYIDLPTL